MDDINDSKIIDKNDSNLDILENIQNEKIEDINKIETASLNVRSKRIWLGIYNLDTKKRVSKFLSKPYKLDLDNGKLIIITGHSMFDIVTDIDTKHFNGRDKKYLLISKKDGIKELDKQEYKIITNNKAW